MVVGTRAAARECHVGAARLTHHCAVSAVSARTMLGLLYRLCLPSSASATRLVRGQRDECATVRSCENITHLRLLDLSTTSHAPAPIQPAPQPPRHAVPNPPDSSSRHPRSCSSPVPIVPNATRACSLRRARTALLPSPRSHRIAASLSLGRDASRVYWPARIQRCPPCPLMRPPQRSASPALPTVAAHTRRTLHAARRTRTPHAARRTVSGVATQPVERRGAASAVRLPARPPRRTSPPASHRARSRLQVLARLGEDVLLERVLV